MVKESDRQISDIPSRFVGYDRPFCEKHQEFMRVWETIRNENEDERRLTVIRKCYCPACKNEGVKTYQKTRNTRYFKKSPYSGDSCHKKPNDQN